jgi:large subunit ribosomal protein L35
MPKMKTKSGASKRLKVTGSGKIKRKRAFRAHLLTKKSSKSKRHLATSRLIAVHKRDEKSAKKMLKIL